MSLLAEGALKYQKYIEIWGWASKMRKNIKMPEIRGPTRVVYVSLIVISKLLYHDFELT